MKEEKNKIPRKFYRLVVEMLADTDSDRAGDLLYIYKNDFGYLSLNTRTADYLYMPAGILRDATKCKIKEIK